MRAGRAIAMLCAWVLSWTCVAGMVERTVDEQVWDLYQQTKGWPLDVFNRALDLLDDTARRAVPSDFVRTHPPGQATRRIRSLLE